MKQKGLRKLVSMILAVVMVLAMSMNAFAYTISFTSSVTGYSYDVYQIFTGELSEDGNTLSNIDWGSALADSEVQNALLNKYNATDVTGLAEAIDEADDAQGLAEFLADYLESMTAYDTLDDSTTSLTGVPAGYYLIVNTAVPSGDYGYSNYIVEIINDLTISPKDDSTPDFDKTVGDEDGDEDATEDYAIGDSVPFTLTATLPTSYSAYTTYKLVFTDTLSDGLTFNEDSLTVTAGEDNTLTEDTDYTLEISEDGQTITVTITDLVALNLELESGDTVVVSYTAELNENAESIENNTASLEYSNNPNGEQTGTTEEDKTYVVTFTVTVDKTDKDGNALKGAGFTLYTKADDTDTEYTEVVKEFTAGDATSFAFNGLAIGDYKLVETTTPDGYNTIDPIYFTITGEAEESATSDTGVTVTASVSSDDATFTVNTNDATDISTTVVNNAGSTLPSTGGMGTTIFYIVGGVLVLGAAVLFVTKKRLGSEN